MLCVVIVIGLFVWSLPLKLAGRSVSEIRVRRPAGAIGSESAPSKSPRTEALARSAGCRLLQDQCPRGVLILPALGQEESHFASSLELCRCPLPKLPDARPRDKIAQGDVQCYRRLAKSRPAISDSL